MRVALALTALALVPLAVPGTARAEKACGGKAVTISGSPDADTIRGTEHDDVIRAGGGDDRIEAAGGDDTICAGPGDDTISAGIGSDRARNGAGDDHSEGGEGDDELLGQGGIDDADGREGIDACLVEDHQNCEADLVPGGSGPLPFTGGDQKVFNGTLSVFNNGPSNSQRTLGTGRLPSEAEFVAAESDPRCSELATDEITCLGEGIPAHGEARFSVAFRFPDCPPPNHSVTFTVTAQDYLTIDPQPQNNTSSIFAPLGPAPSCP